MEIKDRKDLPDDPDKSFQETLQFGVGCFHFAPAHASTYKNSQHFLKDLERFFLKDKLVTEVIINRANNSVVIFDEESTNFSDDIGDLNNLDPYADGLRIIAKYHIPIRIQKEYIGSWRSPVSEEITLEVEYLHGIPIAYVWCRSAEKSPSTAVHILWKHFKANKEDGFPILFQMLGPSPFHADFFVHASAGSSPEVRLEQMIGYDDVHITLDEKISTGEISKYVQTRLSEELRLFYTISSESNDILHKFHFTYSDITSLIEGQSLKQRICNFFVKGSRTYHHAVGLERFLIQREEVRIRNQKDSKRLEEMFGQHLFVEKNQ